MHVELKAKWLEALRSGDYDQGTGSLCRDGRYCCLGVLCEVMGIASVRHEDNGERVYYVECPTSDGSVTAPPAGANTGIPNDDINKLIRLNDDDGANFLQIADWIEENL